MPVSTKAPEKKRCTDCGSMIHAYANYCPMCGSRWESADVVTALRDLLAVIEADDLIPESVSYMRQARAALAKAEGR